METYKRWVRRNKDYVHSMESLANPWGLKLSLTVQKLGLALNTKIVIMFDTWSLVKMHTDISKYFHSGHWPINAYCVFTNIYTFYISLLGLTWLLPERFSDSEIGPEAATSFFGIITAINEHIIETTTTERASGQAETPSFPYSLCMTLLKDLETLVEVAAQQFYGDDRKWKFIAATEAIKVLVRLAMIRDSGYKMLLHGGETVNVEKGSDAVNYSKQRHGDLVDPRSHNLKNYYQQTPWNLEGKALSALSRFGENARMVSERTWLSRVQHQQAIMEPPTLMVEKPSLSTFLSEKGVPGGLFVMGEVMFVIRPLLYVLLIRKYGTRSWFPWLMSLGVDLIGNGILSAVAASRNSRKGPLFYLSNDERDELKRRKLLCALYLMRDPFFTKYTRKRLDHTQKLLEPVPVIGFFAEKLIELLVGAQTRYTYMSGS